MPIAEAGARGYLPVYYPSVLGLGATYWHLLVPVCCTALPAGIRYGTMRSVLRYEPVYCMCSTTYALRIPAGGLGRSHGSAPVRVYILHRRAMPPATAGSAPSPDEPDAVAPGDPPSNTTNPTPSSNDGDLNNNNNNIITYIII